MDRERLWRYDATVHGLLYLTGLLHAAQAMEFFLGGVMQRGDPMAREIARRYLQTSFDYITDGAGGMILLHIRIRADPLVADGNLAAALAHPAHQLRHKFPVTVLAAPGLHGRL